jgi:hypothetical protein
LCEKGVLDLKKRTLMDHEIDIERFMGSYGLGEEKKKRDTTS